MFFAKKMIWRNFGVSCGGGLSTIALLLMSIFMIILQIYLCNRSNDNDSIVAMLAGAIFRREGAEG